MRRAIPGLVWAALALLAAGPPLSAQTSRLGTIDFPTSGAPVAQPQFIRGVLLLHSFEYRDAAQAFREAQRLDPGFALAYWGEALTYTHPIWNEQDLSAARAALQRLGPTPAARRAKAPTPREQAYLETVEILYGDGSKTKRDTAYSLALERLVASFPADREAQVFYALSLLGLSQGVRDVPTYMRAAAIAEKVFRDNPNHPGASHLLIHCYDDPIRAPLGLPAARAYSNIAPDAAHAQHMTTHIFLALGMWDEVVSQNELASGRDRAAWTANHYTAWLGYGYLQQGRYGDALRHVNLMQKNMDWSRPRQRAELALMRADYVVNTERWDSPSLRWHIDVTDARQRDLAVEAFVAAVSALKRGDRTNADRGLAYLVDLSRGHAAAEPGHATDQVPVIVEKELHALLRQADGAVDDAVALLREATALEDAMPLEFGPPAVVKPSHELLCEVLLQADRPREAQVQGARALPVGAGPALAFRAPAAPGERAEPGKLTDAAPGPVRHRHPVGPALRAPSRRRPRHRPAPLQAPDPRHGRAPHGLRPRGAAAISGGLAALLPRVLRERRPGLPRLATRPHTPDHRRPDEHERMDGRPPRHPVPRGGREARRQVVPRRGRRRRRDVAQHPRRKSLGRCVDRLRPERRATPPRAGLPCAARRAGVGRERQREVDPPHRARRSAVHDARGDGEVHRPAPRRDGAHVQLRDGREVDHHVSGIPGRLDGARVVGDPRARLERPRPCHPRGREHRRRQDLGTCRVAGARATEVPYPIPPPVELGRARRDAHEPRGGRDRLRAAHPRRAP